MRETERESTRLAVETTPSLDLVFDLLSNRRRRHALYVLYEQSDGVATIEELVDSILTFDRQYADAGTDAAGVDTETPASQSDGQRQAVRTELQHVHLPKLEEAGILEHDKRSETVRYWTQPSLEEWLEHAHHKERRFHDRRS